MKVRHGFVSNSSSSSYTIITTKAIHDEVMATLSQFEQEVIKRLGVETQKFLGQDVVSIGCTSGNYSSFEYMDLPSKLFDEMNEALPEDKQWESKSDAMYEAWETYQKLVKKNKDQYVSVSVDM